MYVELYVYGWEMKKFTEKVFFGRIYLTFKLMQNIKITVAQGYCHLEVGPEKLTFKVQILTLECS